jgi:hypothetical protein
VPQVHISQTRIGGFISHLAKPDISFVEKSPSAFAEGLFFQH